jgi:hypothetical protein
MRERTTWNRKQIVKLAESLKKADDPRAMNQDHLKQQPAADKYEIGGPSEFAEDVAPNNWKAEYSGGDVKRNEIGLPEMRGETFSHSEKTAADDEEDDDFLEKKADVCLDIARRMLPKNASEKALEDQAFAFMHMADADIVATAARLASQDEEDKGEQDQDKQAGEVPENFKKDDDKKDQGQQEAKQAGQVPENFKKDDDKKDEGQQSKEAQGQQQKSDEDKGQQSEQQSKEAALNDLRKRACDALMQGDQAMAQQLVQQMAQQQQAPAQQMSQEQAQQQIDQMLAQQTQQMQQDPAQQQVMASDAELLDRMLAEPTVASTDTAMTTASAGSMGDIQIEGASMDMSEVRLGSEDEALTALFASHDEVQNAAHAHSLQTGIPVQASTGMSRTASTRTVGTRPTGGVSQLGGGSAPSRGSEVDKLSGLWASAPDVKNVFDT